MNAHVENTNLNASSETTECCIVSPQRMKRKVEAQLGIMDSRTLPVGKLLTLTEWTSSAETTFDSTNSTLDGDNTKFLSNIDTKRTKLTDGNSYVKFPRDTITDLDPKR